MIRELSKNNNNQNYITEFKSLLDCYLNDYKQWKIELDSIELE